MTLYPFLVAVHAPRSPRALPARRPSRVSWQDELRSCVATFDGGLLGACEDFARGSGRYALLEIPEVRGLVGDRAAQKLERAAECPYVGPLAGFMTFDFSGGLDDFRYVAANVLTAAYGDLVNVARSVTFEWM